MKQGKTLVQLAEEIERRAAAKKDYIVDTAHMTMTVGEGPKPTLVFGETTLGVNDIAHAQLAEGVGIPKPYYDRMLAEKPELLARNVNEWLAANPKNQLVRTLDGTARAYLSDKYRPLENEDLARAVIPVLLDLDVEIMSSEITERRFYIKAVDKKIVRALAEKGAAFGDGGHTIIRGNACPAITIGNSEVGMGALSILAGYYNDWCSNLATFNERSMRKYHVGAKNELLGDNISALLSDETRQKTDIALWAQVGDVVKNAFDQARFDALVDKVEGTVRDRIEGDPVKVVNLSSKRFGLTEVEGKSVLRHLIEGGSLTRFGLHNAVTRASQDAEDYDRATELERIGGNIIDLPRSEWEEVAKAA